MNLEIAVDVENKRLRLVGPDGAVFLTFEELGEVNGRVAKYVRETEDLARAGK
jgi:hypothetical protein